MTKRQQKELNAKARTVILFNTGDRIMKTAKHKSRNELKQETKRIIKEEL